MKKFLLSFLTLFIALFAFQLFAPLTPDANAQGWTQGQEAVSSGQTGLPETTARNVVLNVLKWLLSLVFVLTVLAFVGSGIIFIMSFGNSGLTEMAKNWLSFAIIGLIVSVLGFVIVLAISNMLTGNLQNTRGGGGGGGFWANIWGQDNNGNGININTGPNGTTVDGSLGDFDFSGIPIPISTPGSNNTPAQPWVNPDTGQNYDYNTGR
jgi:hypothetical protein